MHKSKGTRNTHDQQNGTTSREVGLKRCRSIRKGILNCSNKAFDSNVTYCLVQYVCVCDTV